MPISEVIRTWIKKLIDNIKLDEIRFYSDYIKNEKPELNWETLGKIRGVSKEIPSPTIKLEPFYNCHFHWFLKHQGISTRDIFLIRTEKWLQDIEEFPPSEKFSVEFSLYLTKAITKFHCGDTAESLKEIQLAMTYVLGYKYDNEFNPKRYRAYLGLAYANAYFIYDALRMGKESGEMEQSLMELSADSNEAKAMVLSLKSIFYGQIGDQPKKLLLCKEAIDLDRKYWFYLDRYSRALRTFRRQCNIMSIPTDEEVWYAQKAFELNPNSSFTLHRMALLYEETLKGDWWTGNNKLLAHIGADAVSERMIWSIRAALDLNPHSVTANVKLAEILHDQFHRYTDIAAANDRFNLCVKRWPENSEVLHKIGKFYHNTRKNCDQALIFYKRSLKFCPENFSALMDLIKLLFSRREHEDALAILDANLGPRVFDNIHSSKLQIMKAVALWILQRPEEAMDSVLHAFELESKYLKHMWFHIRSVFRVSPQANFSQFLAMIELRCKNDEKWKPIENVVMKSLSQINRRKYDQSSRRDQTKQTSLVYSRRFNKPMETQGSVGGYRDGEKCPW